MTMASLGRLITVMRPYAGRRAVLATRHGKERAVAAPLVDTTGLQLEVPPDLDTDALGTFTGEVARPASMRDTARLKIQLGLKASGHPIGIASEGSFGPHPALPFAAAAHELLLFRDEELGIEIAETSLSPETNFASLDLGGGGSLATFLAGAGFPRHALVLRTGNQIRKGIRDRGELDRAIAAAGGRGRLETDMRAHMNPTRMAEIAKLARRLARRIATPCPRCTAPGFGALRSETGLTCADCGTPTRLVRVLIEGCARCGHEVERPRPDGRQWAGPAECQECNP